MNQENTNSHNFRLIDYLVILVKWKKFILLTCFFTAIITYLTIYFLIDEKYDAVAVIIPSQQQSMSNLAAMLQDFPVDVGTMGFSNTEMSMYNTIIYSRTVLQKAIDKFNLYEFYDLDRNDSKNRDKVFEILRNDIQAKETENLAYEISFRAKDPVLAAELTNYLIELLNERIIQLKIQKSRENKEFLSKRVNEIRKNLKIAEDSMKLFQDKSGFMVDEQVKEILAAYTELETNLIRKEIEKSVLEETENKDSPRLEQVEIQVNEYKRKLEKIKKDGLPNSPLLSLESLPQNAVNYFRILRDIEINSKLLEFTLPLYEQAKIDEQKKVPILQVVDYAVPPAIKSFPPRTVLTLIVTFGVFLILIFYILLKENPTFSNSEQYKFIKENIFKWRNK